MQDSNGNFHVLQETTEEKDLGIWTDPSLKFSVHIAYAVKKANQILGLIRRSFTFLDINLMKQLYTVMVRPHLEYGNVVWHPQFKKDLELLEGVQRRATKMVPGLHNLRYEERLRRMDLPSLLYRRLRGDVIETYKYLHGIYNINCSLFLSLSVRDSGVSTRGHSLKLQKRNYKSVLRANVLGYRIVNLWNSLPEDIVSDPTVNSLNGRFDRHCPHLRYSYNCEDFKF